MKGEKNYLKTRNKVKRKKYNVKEMYREGEMEFKKVKDGKKVKRREELDIT